MFSDHMVLQRDMKDPVWGWASPGAKISVSIAGKSATAITGADGRWMMRIGPLKAGGPYELTIDGPQKVTFTDVLAGDVWICSGQSNMEFGLGNVKDPATEAGTADHPNLRLYAMPHLISASPVQVNPAAWQVCTPQTILSDGTWGGFSAVAYYFGAKLSEDEHVPVGLLHTSWGGTPAEAWTREAELSQFPAYKGQLDQLAGFRAEQAKATAAGIADRFADWFKKNDAGAAGWQDPALDESSWKSMDLPGYFQKAGIPELNNNQSVVWFRRTIEVPVDIAASTNTLHFVADDNDAVWINGVQIGATDGPQVQRAYLVPVGTLKAGPNVFAFRITDTGQPGGVYGSPDSFYLQTAKGSPISLAGSWKVKLGVKVTEANAFPSNFDEDPNYPTELYNGMVSPIVPFGIKGSIWYQGESNASPGRAFEYRKLLPAMITSWRNSFDEGAFPFLIVQLAGFGHPPKDPGEDEWAVLRESQFVTAKNLPHTGIATAVDVGDENDIHPKDKKTVGQRLAAVAERQVYRRNVLDSGPTYKSMRVVGSSIEISFDHAGSGLYVRGDGPLFAIAGEDHKWYWAQGEIHGSKMILTSPSVPKPIAVRYYWASFMNGSLYNDAGMPAFPFRTDDWK